MFLTNHMGFGATTLARIYKDRWQVEMFFKALKQNLKIKTFVGTSANAVRVQMRSNCAWRSVAWDSMRGRTWFSITGGTRPKHAPGRGLSSARSSHQEFLGRQ